MKNYILFFLITLSTYANARSLHPCTPMVPAEPIHITCKQNKKIYSIKINVLMSQPIPECSGSNHFESKSASIQVYTEDSQLIGTKTLFNNEFSFSLGQDDGTVAFRIYKPSVYLHNCVTPMNGGGFSVGN